MVTFKCPEKRNLHNSAIITIIATFSIYSIAAECEIWIFRRLSSFNGVFNNIRFDAVWCETKSCCREFDGVVSSLMLLPLYDKFFFAQKLTVRIKSDSPTQFAQSRKNPSNESLPYLCYSIYQTKRIIYPSFCQKKRKKFRFLMLSFPYYSSNIDRISIERMKRNILSMDFVGFLSPERRICILKNGRKYFPQWIASWCSSWNQKKQKNRKRKRRREGETE